MADTMPPGALVPLQAAREHKHGIYLDVMGVVTDFRPACQTKGTDYQCSFDLKDNSFTSYDDGSHGLPVKFFRKDLNALPKIQGTGDVVIARRVQMKMYQGNNIALSNYHTEWIVFPAGGIPLEAPTDKPPSLSYFTSSQSVRVSATEQLYAISLCNSQDRGLFTAPKEALDKHSTIVRLAGKDAMPRNRDSLIKDLISYATNDPRNFRDLIAQVVKTYNPGGSKFTLYVTDYTANALLFDYAFTISESGTAGREGDDYGYIDQRQRGSETAWPGPWGQYTLQVTLWDANAVFAAANVKVGDNVSLRNTFVKLSQFNKLEGRLSGDQRNAEQVNISIIQDQTDARLKSLLERKRAYCKTHLKKYRLAQEATGAASSQKRKHDRESEPEPENKTRSRKQMKKAAKRAAAATAAQAKQPISVVQRQNNDLNLTIRSLHMATPTTPLSLILNPSNPSRATRRSEPLSYTLPFQNLSYRTTVRVVDFFPPLLEDFAVPCGSTEFDHLTPPDSPASSPPLSQDAQPHSPSPAIDDSDGDSEDFLVHDPALQKWEWRFYLLLEDASVPSTTLSHTSSSLTARVPAPQIKVLVTKEDAEFFTNESPVKYAPLIFSILGVNPLPETMSLTQRFLSSLRDNPTVLAQLREKLFILWGDLEERKTAAAAADRSRLNTQNSNAADSIRTQFPSAKPFVCCLKEYGVRLSKRETAAERAVDEDEVDCETRKLGWGRRWRLCGTTIM